MCLQTANPQWSFHCPSLWGPVEDKVDKWHIGRIVSLFIGCLTSQQHASVSQGWICSDNSTCCHTEIEVADQAFYLTQSQYTDTRPTSPSTDPITPGAWQGSHWSANITWPRKNPGASGIQTRDLPLSRRTPSPLGQWGGVCRKEKSNKTNNYFRLPNQNLKQQMDSSVHCKIRHEKYNCLHVWHTSLFCIYFGMVHPLPLPLSLLRTEQMQEG